MRLLFFPEHVVPFIVLVRGVWALHPSRQLQAYPSTLKLCSLPWQHVRKSNTTCTLTSLISWCFPPNKLPTSLSSVHLFFLSAVGSVFLHLSIECVSLVLTSEHFRSTFFKNKNTNKKSMRFRLVSAKNGFFRRQWPQDWICVGLALGEVGAECEGVIGWWPWLGMYLWFW